MTILYVKQILNLVVLALYLVMYSDRIVGFVGSERILIIHYKLSDAPKYHIPYKKSSGKFFKKFL